MADQVDLAPGQDDDLTRELHRRSLVQFVRDAWHVLHPPSEEYVHNWHIDAICAHLEAVTDGRIRRLLINVPPGHSKSILVNVLWPAWEWGPRGLSYMQYMCTTYEKDRLGKRDVERMRHLVGSDWYQRLYGHNVTVNTKKDTAEMFAVHEGGWREVRPIRGLTGGRANRLCIDDPHSVNQAESDAERQAAVRLLSESAGSRLKDPQHDAMVVIMQRLHERDYSGYIIEQELDDDTGISWDHLCLPTRYEHDHPYPTRSSIGFTDPRVEDGELLFPDFFTEEVVANYEKEMGGRDSYAVAGQLQQRPEPRGGGMVPVHVIRKETLRYEEPKHKDIESIVRYWDKAGTRDAGKYTAGVLMARLKNDAGWFVLDVVRERMASTERDQMIRRTAEQDAAYYGQVMIYLEREPGSGGKDSYRATAKQLEGFPVDEDPVGVSKPERMQGLASQVGAGNVYVLQRRWTEPFLAELGKFPVGRYADQADAAAGAFNRLLSRGRAGALGSNRRHRRPRRR